MSGLASVAAGLVGASQGMGRVAYDNITREGEEAKARNLLRFTQQHDSAEASKDRTEKREEAARDRSHRSVESAADRSHRSIESAANRSLDREQGDANRATQREVAGIHSQNRQNQYQTGADGSLVHVRGSTATPVTMETSTGRRGPGGEDQVVREPFRPLGRASGNDNLYLADRKAYHAAVGQIRDAVNNGLMRPEEGAERVKELERSHVGSPSFNAPTPAPGSAKTGVGDILATTDGKAISELSDETARSNYGMIVVDDDGKRWRSTGERWVQHYGSVE